MSLDGPAESIAAKMHHAGVAEPVIQAFRAAVERVRSGQDGLLPEPAIEPVAALPRLETLVEEEETTLDHLLDELVVIKLNGGLGTGMGLARAKSLIPVKNGDRFLDFIVRQLLHLHGPRGIRRIAFYLMNSQGTRRDTLDYLRKYPELGREGDFDFLQNLVPKLDAQTLEPVSWLQAPELEWCPPGHGDIYISLVGSGLLDRLLERGLKYAFVSNSDNLGATVDLPLLSYFARSGLGFLMEVAGRTAADRKGGHLARRRRDGHLVLRESAQCPKEDEAAFQNIDRHRYFNTNNLWIRLDQLRTELTRHGGTLPLPLIRNMKTVDPRQPESPRVLQLESAMGAAIECFEEAGAVVVPRTRFAPVKTTSDLLALRSDAYVMTDDFRLVLAPSRHGVPPMVELDSRHYRLLADFERHFAQGPPSLLHALSVQVQGSLDFEAGVVCQARVQFYNSTSQTKTVPAGTYREQRLEW